MRRTLIAVLHLQAAAAATVLGLVVFPGSGVAADAPSITVAAASSVTEMVDELGKAFTAQSGVAVRASFSASSVAARQVMNGAPFDILISANPAWIDAASQAGAIDAESVRTLAGNALVVIAGPRTPLNSNKSVRDVLNIAGVNNWRIAIADPDHVPAGQYALQALRSIGFWDNLKRQMVPLQNVRAVVALVDRGEAAIGLAYATDIRVSMGSREVARFEPGLHEPILYRAAVAGHAPAPEAAAAFIEFALSSEGQRVVAALGFVTAAETGDGDD
ncbi:MAG: molybdate ABC transporter substrate-binding protein [Rhodospirillales bacterium]